MNDFTPFSRELLSNPSVLSIGGKVPFLEPHSWGEVDVGKDR